MFAQTYMSNIDQSNTTEALQSIIDCLKTEHKDLSKIRVDLSANVQKSRLVDEAKKLWHGYDEARLSYRQALVNARELVDKSPQKYMGVDIGTFFFCREKDALFSWSEEHNDFTNLVKFTDTVKLSLFENEIVESAHTKAVDVIKTLMKIIKRAEKLGMDKEQVAEVIKLLIKERIPNQYEAIAEVTNPNKLFDIALTLEHHLKRPAAILGLIRSIARKPDETIGAVLNRASALLTEYFQSAKPYQTLDESRNDAEREAKRMARFFIEPPLNDELKKFGQLMTKQNKSVTLTEVIQFIEQAEITDVDKFGLKSTKTAVAYTEQNVIANVHDIHTRSKGPPPERELPKKWDRGRERTRSKNQEYNRYTSSESRSTSPTSHSKQNQYDKQYSKYQSKHRSPYQSPYRSSSNESNNGRHTDHGKSRSHRQNTSKDRYKYYEKDSKKQYQYSQNDNRRHSSRSSSKEKYPSSKTHKSYYYQKQSYSKEKPVKNMDDSRKGLSRSNSRERTNDAFKQRSVRAGSPLTGSSRSVSPQTKGCRRCLSQNHETKQCFRYKETTETECEKCHQGKHHHTVCRTRRPQENKLSRARSPSVTGVRNFPKGSRK